MDEGWTLPDWLAIHVGRMSVELEYLRHETARLLRERAEQEAAPEPPDEGD